MVLSVIVEKKKLKGNVSASVMKHGQIEEKIFSYINGLTTLV
jgi:hypothetical protein